MARKGIFDLNFVVVVVVVLQPADEWDFVPGGVVGWDEGIFPFMHILTLFCIEKRIISPI